MYFLLEIIDFLQQRYIFLHNSRIFLLMHILILLQHLPQVVYIVFQVLSLVCVLSVQVSVSLLVLDFFFDILLMQSDNSFFEFLEICNVVKALKYIVFEFLLICNLFI